MLKFQYEHKIHTNRSFTSWTCDLYLILGYLFWTLFQALAPMIWFYPLNELEISGFEAFAVCLFSPALIGLPFAGHILTSRWTVAFLRLEFSCENYYRQRCVNGKLTSRVRHSSSQELVSRGKMRPVGEFPWLASLLWVSFSAVTLLVLWQEWHPADGKLLQQFLKVFFWRTKSDLE